MKKNVTLPLLSLLYLSLLNGMENQQGPMDSVWFYDSQNFFAKANQLHQEQKWKDAAHTYATNLAGLKFGDECAQMINMQMQKSMQMKKIWSIATEYDTHKATLNLAACLMAQRKGSMHWASFDALLDIPESRYISLEIIRDAQRNNQKRLILVHTDQIGIGDIFCFLSAAHELKKRTNWDIILSIPDVLKETLASAATEYNFDIIGAQDIQPTTDYETHLIALLGHLFLPVSQMNPEKVVFTTPEYAMNAVLEQITPVLEQGNILVIADRGEVGRQATLIGGKQLPYDTAHHGRHLDSNPFTVLLNNHSNIVLMDSSSENNRIAITDKQKDRYLTIAPEEQPFDVIIALGRIMSKKKNIIAFGPNMGQTNVFMRALDHDAQNRMAFIIPNPQENDMRMEGEGSKYKHMISNCWVYKCEIPLDQTQVIEQAYNDMLEYTREKK